MVTVRAVHWDDRDAEALRLAQRLEINGRYGDDVEPGPPPSAADVTVVVVAYDGGRAVGTGALRALDDTSGEVKRMYVVPDRRGAGVSSAVLAALEQEARGRGWTHLRLETGDILHEAIRFYTRHGYEPIANFGHYAGVSTSLCFERDLSA
jgi:putative acetyltransferase